ncbi:MAG: hypothetical protein KAS32_07260, partial [Candidatus Peribacteraceae bacterium]|nr:hypothetical protein [Candidatus Peribacteraceae bacterium]
MKRLFLYVLLFMFLPAICFAQCPHDSSKWELENDILAPTYAKEVSITSATVTTLYFGRENHMQLPSDKGTANYVLRTDGIRTLTWASAGAGGTGTGLTSDFLTATYLQQVSNTIIVAKTGGNRATIQGGLDLASISATTNNRYTVLVYPGEYTENLTGKDYVDVIGVADKRDTVKIKGSTGTLLTTQSSSSGIYKNLDFDSTGAGCVISNPSSGNNVLFRNCRFKMTVTDKAMTSVTVTSGKTSFNNCRWNHAETYSSGTTGAQWHRLLYVDADAEFHIRNCNMELVVGDDDDYVIGVSEASAIAAESLIIASMVHITATHATYSGEAAAYYTYGNGVQRHVQGNHMHLWSAGNGTGYAYYLDSSAGGGYIHASGNHIGISGFANNYAAYAAAGDVINLDDDFGTVVTYPTSPGTVNRVHTYAGTVILESVSATKVTATVYMDIPAMADPIVTQGQIAQDTTDNTLIMHDGTAERVMAHAVQTHPFTINDDGNWLSENQPIFMAPKDMAVTIIQISTVVTGTGTVTMSYNIQEKKWASMSGSAVDLFNANQ